MKFTKDQLHQIFPALGRAKCTEYAPYLAAAANEALINTRQRACAFFAQLGHESQDLKFLREIWGNTPAQYRYDVRTDLGNTPERDGDGKKYMGRGGLQRTGKANYRRFQEATGVDVLNHPELLEQPNYAFRSDCLYWTDNQLNRLADQLTLRGDAGDLKTFDRITKSINGGYNGRVDRQRRYLVAIATLPDDVFTTPDTPPASALDLINPVTPAPTPAPVTPATAENHQVLLEKLSASESAKTVGASVVKKFFTRLAGPCSLLYAALEAGNIYAWLGVGVLLAGAVVLVYIERKKLMSMAKSTSQWIHQKISGA